MSACASKQASKSTTITSVRKHLSRNHQLGLRAMPWHVQESPPTSSPKIEASPAMASAVDIELARTPDPYSWKRSWFASIVVTQCSDAPPHHSSSVNNVLDWQLRLYSQWCPGSGVHRPPLVVGGCNLFGPRKQQCIAVNVCENRGTNTTTLCMWSPVWMNPLSRRFKLACSLSLSTASTHRNGGCNRHAS